VVEIRVDDAVSDDKVAALWPVYDAIFGDHPDIKAWRASVVFDGRSAAPPTPAHDDG
jgi:hypothetical protein